MACQDITKFGIFDLSYTNIDEGIAQSVRQWVKSNRFQTQSDAHQGGYGLGVTLPIDNVLLNGTVNANYGDSHSNNWSDDFESEFTKNTEMRTNLVQTFKHANADIVRAWEHCEEQAGFKCWAIQPGNSHDVILKMMISKPHLPFKGALITHIGTSEHVVLAEGETYCNTTVTNDPVSVLFKRVGPDAALPVTFTVQTSDINYHGDCTVNGLPQSRLEVLPLAFDQGRTGYAHQDPGTRLITVAPGTQLGSPCNACFKINLEESGTYALVVEYATQDSRPCDVLLNLYDPQGQPIYPDYLTFLKNLAAAVTITNALTQATGGNLRSTTVGMLDLRKGLNTVNIRARAQNEPGYQGSGFIPDIRGISLMREVSLRPSMAF